MKKIIAFLFVLVLVCSSLWAFEGVGKLFKKSSVESEEPSQEVALQEHLEEAVETAEEIVADTQSSSEESQPLTSNPVSAVVDSLSLSSKLTKKGLQDLMQQLYVVRDDVDLLIADNEEKDAQLKAVKFFANMGGVVGFRNADKVVPTLGVVANVGVKAPNGLQYGTGLQYMLCDFASEKKIDCSWDISKLSITATVGYEW